MTRPTATEPTEVVIGFESGLPVSVDGTALQPAALIAEVNRIVGSYGFGRLDMVENRRVGIKSREAYECPAALALLMAHADLEDLTLERDLHHEKIRLEPRWSELVYDGLWFSPLKQALDAFFAESQRHVTGEVRLRLDRGQCWVVGRRSPVSLYDHGLATYDASDTFRHQDAEGFVRLWGLGVATWSAVQQGPNDPSRTGLRLKRPDDPLAWPSRRWHRRRGHGLFRRAFTSTGSWPSTTSPARGPMCEDWAGGDSWVTTRWSNLLDALDQVERELTTGASPSSPTTRTSTPRSSGG